MIDATQLSYMTTVRWENPPASDLNLGEEASCKVTLDADHADHLHTHAELIDSLVYGAIDAWRWKIEQRMGEPPPADARLVVSLSLDAATGKPVAYLCTMVEDEADEPQAE